MTQIDRIQLGYRLTFTTPFHCGAGLSSGIIERTVVRDVAGSLYIPGSTFKGVVRVHCERLARIYALSHEVEIRRQVVGIHDEEQAIASMYRPATMIERIFGSRSQPGLLSFDDARQFVQESQGDAEKRAYAEDRDRIEQTSVRMQVRLDRRTRTVVKDTFYGSEFGLKDLTFYGSISGWLNCTPIEDLKDLERGPSYSLLLLLAGISLLEQIGGSKSTGKGQCTCEITDLSINSIEFSNAVLRSWLEHLDLLIFYPEQSRLQEER